MLSWLSKKDKHALGLDISASSVKLLELSGSAPNYQVKSYARVPLPHDAIVEQEIKDSQAIIEAIKEAVNRAKPSTKQAVVAVPNAAAISKILTMPSSLKGSDLEAQINVEAERHVPYPLDEVSLDFQVLPMEDPKADEMEVLLVACKRETVGFRSDILEEAGLTPFVVEIEDYANERSCALMQQDMPDLADDGLIAVIDLGATITSVYIYNQDKIIYHREENFGSRMLIDQIKDHAEMDFQAAEIALVQNELPQSIIDTVIPAFIDSICQEIERALQFFYSSSEEINIAKVLLAGGLANLQGLEEAIKNTLQLDTHIAAPLAQASYASGINKQTIEADMPSLLIATGLAIRGVG